MFRLLLVCCASACALSAPANEPLGQDDECSDSSCAVNALQSRVSLRSEDSCHDAVPGDACYKDIMWAKHTGIRQHPHWYPGLTASSSNADFQEIVHTHSPNKCSLPCAKTAGCHTAQKGESCYNDIMWAKNTGIRQHSSWYPGLSPSSSDAEFQASIHAKRPDKCPEPCMDSASPAPPLQPEPEPVIPPQIPEIPAIPDMGPGPVIIPPQEPIEPETTATTTEFIIPVVPDAQPAPAPPQHESHPAPAPAPQPEVDRYPQCPKMPQSAREACEQEAIQKEQHEREERERQEQEAEKQHERETPLDVRHQEIIDEIGGEPTVDGMPDFDDPDR